MARFEALLPARDTLNRYWVWILGLVCVGAPVVAMGIALRILPRGLTTPTGPTEFWDLISGLASVLTLAVTIAVGIVAWYGLRSLRLARQDMVTRATRESISMAIERAEQFSEIIRIQNWAIHQELAAAKIPLFTSQLATGTAVFDDEQNMYPKAQVWWNSVPTGTRQKILYLMNDLEAWAMYFTHRLADSEVVSGPCAVPYCSIVLQYSPWIVICRKEMYSGFYPNIVRLFHAWRAELDSKDKGSQTEAALRSARAAEQRLKEVKVQAPLGTKVDI